MEKVDLIYLGRVKSMRRSASLRVMPVASTLAMVLSGFLEPGIGSRFLDRLRRKARPSWCTEQLCFSARAFGCGSSRSRWWPRLPPSGL